MLLSFGVSGLQAQSKSQVSAFNEGKEVTVKPGITVKQNKNGTVTATKKSEDNKMKKVDFKKVDRKIADLKSGQPVKTQKGIFVPSKL